MKRNRKSSSESELSPSVQSVREARRKAGKRNVKQLRVDTDESVMTTESEIPTERSGFQQLADILLSFKEQTNRHLEGIFTTMSEMQFQMQEQMNIIVDDVTGMKTSLEGAWVEIEALKSVSDQQNATIARLEKSVTFLQAEQILVSVGHHFYEFRLCIKPLVHNSSLGWHLIGLRVLGAPVRRDLLG